MQLLVYVWTRVKGQTMHWVKANFLAGGKTTSLWWISDACRLCDLHFISCNLLFCLTGSIPFVSSFWTLSHGNQSNCYNMGKCGLDNSLIQQSSTIRKSKAHIAFCISYNYKKMIIKNFLFFSYITPTSQSPYDYHVVAIQINQIIVF